MSNGKKILKNIKILLCLVFIVSAIAGVYFVLTQADRGQTLAGIRNLVSFKKLGFNFNSARAADIQLRADVGVVVRPACDDWIDNDGDGLIDYPADPGCDSPEDNDEYDAPPSDTDETDKGGGGAPPPTIQTIVVLKGKAYPNAKITILKDGQTITTTNADNQADFNVRLTTLTAGTYSFGLWAEDKKQRRSITVSYTVSVTANMTTTINGIMLPPTISLSKDNIEQGEVLDIQGQSSPLSEISVYIAEIINKLNATSEGEWLLSFNTNSLAVGSHSAKAKGMSSDGLISNFSQALPFSIRAKGEPPPKPQACPRHPDINKDKKVDLVDFSILLYNWGDKPKKIEADFNCDNKVNLTDFSIMMYWWTG